MIDSLLFLPDVDGLAADAVSTADLALDFAPTVEPGDGMAAEVAAALAATRDGHAHAVAGAWAEASAAFERSAGMRDGLVAAGVAGPIVAVRAWSDLATVRVAAGDLDGAHAALARVRAGVRDLPELPADLVAAIADLDAALGAPEHPANPTAATSVDPALEQLAGGLRWLDTTGTTDAAGQDAMASDVPAEHAPASDTAVPGDAPTHDAPAPGARIAAVDAAVALAQSGDRERATGGLAARLRRLIRR